MVPLASLVPWPGNPRVNDEAAKRLAVLIQEHGFVNPVVVWGAGNVVYAGCTRLKAAAILGLAEVPVIRVNFRDEEQAVAFALADNRSGEWASWDEPALVEALNQLESVDVEAVVRMTGFEQAEIEGIKTGWDEPEKATVEKSDGSRLIKCPYCGGEWEEE
jgi:site-specific DNA-methyltransferase (adenine-specific)